MSDGAEVGCETPETLVKRKHWGKKKISEEKDPPSEGSPSTKKKTHSSKVKQHKKSKSLEEKVKKEKPKKKKKSKKGKESSKTDPSGRREVPGDESDGSKAPPEETNDFLRESKGKEEEAHSSETYVGDFNSDQEIDSEGDDFIGNFEFYEEHRPEKPFVCLQENEIVDEQNREIQKISELLSVSVSQAAGLLRFYKWNKDKLLTSYFDDPDAALELAGVKVKTSGPVENDMGILLVDNRCSICDEEAGLDLELFGMDCKHYFCGLCWEQYLTMQIQEGHSGLIPCPSYDCGLLVDEKFLKRLVPEEVYTKYLLFLTKSFVDGNSQVNSFFSFFLYSPFSLNNYPPPLCPSLPL